MSLAACHVLKICLTSIPQAHEIVSKRQLPVSARLIQAHSALH